MNPSLNYGLPERCERRERALCHPLSPVSLRIDRPPLDFSHFWSEKMIFRTSPNSKPTRFCRIGLGACLWEGIDAAAGCSGLTDLRGRPGFLPWNPSTGAAVSTGDMVCGSSGIWGTGEAWGTRGTLGICGTAGIRGEWDILGICFATGTCCFVGILGSFWS